MNTKTNKSVTKTTSKNCSVRISLDNKKRIKKIMANAHSIYGGRKLKFDQIFALAVDLITDEHIKKAQQQNLKGSDHQEIMRQKYIKEFGPISKDEYLAFTTTNAYAEFLIRQNTPDESVAITV